MNTNNKKAMSLLVVLGFFISVLAVFGAPVGATAGRAPNFAVALSITNDTGVNVTEANVSDALYVNANITIASGQPNATNMSITLFINDAQADFVAGAPLNNSTTSFKAYVNILPSSAYGNYKISVLAMNSTDIANATNQTIAVFTIKGADIKVTTVTSNPAAGLVGITDITFTATLVNIGNAAGDANVTFKLETVPSINLGYKVVNVLTTGGSAVFVYNFMGVTVADGSYNVSASLPGSSNVTLVTLTNPIVNIIIMGIDITPETVTVRKGETKEVMVDVHVKNNGTMAAPNVTINFYLDAAITTPFSVVLLEEQVLPLADKYVTLYYNFTDAQIGIHNFHAGVAGTPEGGEQWFDSANVTVEGEANGSIESFTLSAASGFEGDNVTMTAKFFNNGTADGTGNVEFLYGTTVIGTKLNQTIVKGGYLEVSFTYTLMNITGDNMTQLASVRAGTMTKGANLTIVKRKPVYEIVSLTLPTGTLRVGDTVTLQAVVKNNGTGAGTLIVVDFYDGATKMNSSVAFNLTAGSSNTVSVQVILAGTGDVNHTFVVKVGTVEKSANATVGHKLSEPSINILSFVVSPKTKDKQPKDSTQSYVLTIVLKNTGEKVGTVTLTIKEGKKVLNTQNVTIDGGLNTTKTVTWSVKGDGSHSAVATIAGNVGTTTTLTAKCTLKYTPGFEVIFLAAAILVAAVLVRRRKN